MPKRKTIKLKGGAARKFMAESMVDRYGAKALNMVEDRMKPMVQEVLDERKTK